LFLIKQTFLFLTIIFGNVWYSSKQAYFLFSFLPWHPLYYI
jgi:hypothetical protein